MVNGVFNVYNEDDTHYNDFIYPELKMFVDDFHLLVKLISNGPL
jgi:hypothetical protein